MKTLSLVAYYVSLAIHVLFLAMLVLAVYSHNHEQEITYLLWAILSKLIIMDGLKNEH